MNSLETSSWMLFSIRCVSFLTTHVYLPASLSVMCNEYIDWFKAPGLRIIDEIPCAHGKLLPSLNLEINRRLCYIQWHRLQKNSICIQLCVVWLWFDYKSEHLPTTEHNIGLLDTQWWRVFYFSEKLKIDACFVSHHDYYYIPNLFGICFSLLSTLSDFEDIFFGFYVLRWVIHHKCCYKTSRGLCMISFGLRHSHDKLNRNSI